MLETRGVLKTWACPDAPETQKTMIVQSLADHRLAYLKYEGTVSGSRGEVHRWDDGTYQFLHQGEGKLVLLFAGRILRGSVTLECITDEPQRWTFSLAEA